MMTTTGHNTTKPAADTDIKPLFAKDYKVYINHTDAGGIVYHANHLVFFENCRRDWFTELGLNGYFLQTDKGEVQHFVVSQVDLQYKSAILLDETVSVRVDKVALKPASIIFYQSIRRHTVQDNATEESTKKSNANAPILSSAKIVIACVQNLVKIEPMANSNADSASSDTSDSAARTAPMRPIRVPKPLRDAIEQAMDAQTSQG